MTALSVSALSCRFVLMGQDGGVVFDCGVMSTAGTETLRKKRSAYPGRMAISGQRCASRTSKSLRGGLYRRWRGTGGPVVRAFPHATPVQDGVIDTGSPLGTFNHANFSDRIKASASAKMALVEKLKARPGPDDPRRQAVAAERKAVHEARLARQAERQRLLQEQRECEAEERRKRDEEELAAALSREAALEEERLAAEKARRERASRVVTDLAEQKARRDARYAARKSRQKAR